MICSSPTCTLAGKDQPQAEFRVRGKRTCRTCIRQQQRQIAARRRTGSPVDREPGGNLPMGPFRDWLLELLEQAALTRDDPVQFVTARLQITERTMSRWLNDKGAVLVHHDSADRCFCNWGEPALMRELYPHTYGLVPDDVAQAA